MYDCYENIKIKVGSTISILKPWHYNFLITKENDYKVYLIIWGKNNILLFLAEQISLMLFYYVQDVYQKNQQRTR